MQYVKRLYVLILGWFNREEITPPIETPPEALPPPQTPLDAAVAQKPDTTLVQPRRSDVELNGQFYFRDAILDQLDFYFVCLARMKRADRDSYDLYSRVGAMVIPYRIEASCGRLSAWWRAGNRPGFGAVAFAIDPRLLKREDKSICPRFLYFEKLTRPPAVVQKAVGDVYRVVGYFDCPNDPKYKAKRGLPIEFYVAVDAAANIRVLKINWVEVNNVWSKRHKHWTPIPSKKWDVPKEFKTWWGENRNRKLGDGTLDSFAATIFTMAANYYEETNSGARVTVSKGGLTAAFGIDIKRTAYFFSDRNVTLTAKGTKRKVFHIVRAHERNLKSGKQAFVRFHFRGEQEFGWNGHKVKVTMPGLHHRPLMEFDVGMYAEYDNKEKDLINMAGMAAKVRNHVLAPSSEDARS